VTRLHFPRAEGGGASSFYGRDLAQLHHSAFGDLAARAAPGLVRLIRAAGFTRGLVVDLGCGSGIWARQLLRAGYDVFGVDVSRAMIRLARTVAPRGRFTVGSVHQVALPPCIAVTAIGEGVTYLAARQRALDLARLFRRVYTALRPGGPFIFDVVARSERHPMRYRTEQQGADWRVVVDVLEEPAHSLLTRRILVERTTHGRTRRTTEVHRLRTFARHELEEGLRAAGFSVRVRRAYGSARLAPRRLALIACKPRGRPSTFRPNPA
jgi:SAM-dependent methyltransferase